MGGKSKDFFEQLREKLTDSPTKEQDRNFWVKFDREFGRRPLLFLRGPLKRLEPVKVWVPVAVILLLAIALRACKH